MERIASASVIDDLASMETENMAWLRRTGPIARCLNEQSKFDCSCGSAICDCDDLPSYRGAFETYQRTAGKI